MSGKGGYTRKRVDSNHAEIVAALRKAGYSVQSLASIGKGCPDLLIGVPAGKQEGNFCFALNIGFNLLMEVKMPDKKLTPDESKFASKWQGPWVIAHSAEQALSLVGLMKEQYR
jgi:hypothetical protein